MAVDMFLKLTPIEGESKDKKHENEIELLAFSWGMSQSGSGHSGGGSGAGKVSVQDLSVTKYVDKASAKLMLACATGQHIPEGTLVVRKAGGPDALEYITIKMQEIMVTNVQSGGSGGEERLTENVTLNFVKVDYDYKRQTEKGAGDPPSHFGYNMAANVQQ